MPKLKPYRVILRCKNKETIKKAVAELVEKFNGSSELRIGKIHRG